jgi:signal peptidase
LSSTFKRLWKNEYIQTAVMILLVIAIVIGFWYGSRAILNTDYPMLAVASGSMCLLDGSYCDGWSHPFNRTLHVGDLIVVEGINVSDINAAPYPDGDIIVFHQSYSDELIVHRAIGKKTQDGNISFVTKGDGNMGQDSQEVPEAQVIGKVILRIPWVGHLALFMRNSSGVYLIITLIIILVIIELLLPALRGKKPETASEQQGSQATSDSTDSTTTSTTS